MLEVVYHTFSIQKIHGSPKEIPIERSCEPKVFRPAGHISYRNDFFEGHDLDCRHDSNHIDVPRKHGDEKDRNHDQGPYCPSDECLLLQLVIRDRNVCTLSKPNPRHISHVMIKSSPHRMSLSYLVLPRTPAGSVKRTRCPSLLTSGFPFNPFFVGLPGSDAPSLISEILALRPVFVLPPR